MAGLERTTADRGSGDIDGAATVFGLGLALVLGGVVRGFPFLGTDFPLNDGGLFGIMIQDLVANAFRLPSTTSYNALDIPFAYPPLAFYVAGIGDVLGVSVTDTLRGVPLLFSLATIPAVYWLASGVIGTRAGGVLAALFFALLPRSYLYLIIGGGLTRGLGFLLAIIALGLAWRLMQTRNPHWSAVAVLGLDAGLTAIAHPQAAIFLAASILVFLPWSMDWRLASRRLVLSAVISAGVFALWLIPVILVHGVDPLLSASQSGASGPGGLLLLLSLRFGGLVVFDLITIAGLVGAVLAIRRREFMLPLWIAVIWLVDARAGYTYATVPLALLAAYAMLAVISPWLPGPGTRPLDHVRRHRMTSATAVAVLAGLVLANNYTGLQASSPLHALNVDQRSAMDWASENTPDEAVFAVVTGDTSWEQDAVSEWFPALTDRSSAATVQGSEWLGPEIWNRRQDAYASLQACGQDVLTCVVTWSDQFEMPVTHVFVPKGHLHGPASADDCCPAPRHSVELVPGAKVVYDGPGATVIQLP